MKATQHKQRDGQSNLIGWKNPKNSKKKKKKKPVKRTEKT
jgi:hypothetical protein